jgi:hypothetical protein
MPDQRPSIVAAVVRPLARFWWLPVLGLAVAVLAGVQVLDQFRPGWPPRLVERSPQQYTATALLFVDRPDHPFFSTRQIETSPAGQTVRLVCPQTSTGVRKCQYVVEPIPETNHSVPPDTTTSITNANIYPLLIESDQLRAFRDRRFPDLPAGTVSAAAYGTRDLTPTATTAPSGGGRGGFTPSHFPLVEVTAASQSRAGAGTIAAATARAFVEYVDAQQKAQAVPKTQRVDVEILKAPPLGVAAGSSDTPKAFLAAVATMLGCLILPFVLDAAMPPRRRVSPA